MLYNLLKPVLFRLDPERAHHLTLQALNFLSRFKNGYEISEQKPTQLLGLNFKNRIGLAAGLDKNGDYIDALGALGFGHIEIGTVTPKAQSGNPKPRLFRLVEQEAIINRMGFNNKGVDYLVNKVKQRKYQGILGINIGKNAATPLEKAQDDYLFCMQKVYQYADYITVNISSPNTAGLRELQGANYLEQLVKVLKESQNRLSDLHKKYAPLLVKIAPDLDGNEITEMADIFSTNKIDGIIATNTTLDRAGVGDSPYKNETGGLSGAPLFEKATEVLRRLKKNLPEKFPIIASGGVMSAELAKQKFDCGAELVQLYTGLVYKGPGLVRDCSGL